MSSTVADVILEARGHLMDTAAVSGNVLTDAQYLRFVNDALLEIIQQVRALRQFSVIRDTVIQVPANTSFISLSSLSLNFTDLAVALNIWDRPEDSSLNIVAWGGSQGNWLLQVSSTTGLVRGQQIELCNVSDPRLNGSFTILAVPDGTHIQVAGPFSIHVAPPTGGVVSFATQSWNPVQQIDYFINAPSNPITGIGQVAFINGGIQLAAQTNQRQLRIRYLTGGAQVSISTDQLDIPEAMPVLGLLTAIGAATALGGNPDRINILVSKAYGNVNNPMQPGALKLLKRHYTLQSQTQQRVRPLWRPRQAPVYGTLVRT